jgi:hypothetical protein
MGEAKRRKQRNPSFGSTPKFLQNLTDQSYSDQQKSAPQELRFLGAINKNYPLEDAIQNLCQLFDVQCTRGVNQFLGAKVGEKAFYQACKESPELALLWFELALFVGRLKLSIVTKKQIIRFWEEYWINAILILGQSNIKDTQVGEWLSLIKGLIVTILEQQTQILDERSRIEFASIMKTKAPFLSMGETTLDLGLHFRRNRIIYDGQSLIVYKGADTPKEIGELMIAVRHASGCWNHYPSPENAYIPLSDFKRAKSALENFPIPLKGELIHPQSGNLAKLFGLTVKENYAYTANPTPTE